MRYVALATDFDGTLAHDGCGVIGRCDEMGADRVASVDRATQAGVEGATLVRLHEQSHRPTVAGGCAARGRISRHGAPSVEGGEVVGVSGLEPETSALSGQCSNQLS